jgi:hypothetical protein
MAEISLDAKATRNPDAGGELLRHIIGADPLKDLEEGTAVPKQHQERDVKQ